MTLQVAQLQSALRRGRNPDGGWGYYAGKASRLEPTCWALLALGGSDSAVLRRWPATECLLLDREGGPPNYAFHGIALLTLNALGVEHVSGRSALVAAIQQAKGLAGKQADINRQNNTLQAWSWIPDAFSWVEPTAWCLLALKREARSGQTIDAARVRDAEALLVDRCCVTGGWNYGNSNMLGKELPAHVPTTAIALMALQDRPSEPVVERSLAFLRQRATSERSSMAMALTQMALEAYDGASQQVESALAEQTPTTLALSQHLSIAMALVALEKGHGRNAFVL